ATAARFATAASDESPSLKRLARSAAESKMLAMVEPTLTKAVNAPVTSPTTPSRRVKGWIASRAERPTPSIRPFDFFTSSLNRAASLAPFPIAPATEATAAADAADAAAEPAAPPPAPFPIAPATEATAAADAADAAAEP